MQDAVAAPRRPLARSLVLAAWALVILAAYLGGRALAADGTVIRLGAAPLGGWYQWRVNPRVLVPLALGLVLVLALPALAQRLPWRRLLAVSFIAAAAWALSLAAVDGWFGITNPTVLRGDEYLLDVPLIDDPGVFLGSFTAEIDGYVTHVRSHPPGLLLGLWGLDRIGLGGPGWAAALFIAGGAAAVPAVLVALRRAAGVATARRALPFVVVAPAALWVATTADALFAGVSAWAAAAVVLALHRDDARGHALALLGGIGFGIALHLSYGVALVALVPLAVAVYRRRVVPLLVAGLGALGVFAVFSAAGFWWLDGLATTAGEYGESVAATRPYGYFLLANVAALAVVLGPSVVVGITRLGAGSSTEVAGDRAAWLLVGAGLGACALANLSGMSKGEVERIWLPFAVWILPAGLALSPPGGLGGGARRWLALQAGFAVLVQVAVLSRW